MRVTQLIIRSLLLLLIITVQSALAVDSASTLQLTPYNATYEASFNGMAVAATRSLQVVDGNYRLSTTAKSFLGGIKESETFRVLDGTIVVNTYQHERSLLGSKREESLTTDHNSGIVHYTRKNKVRDITLQPGYLGPMSYQIQIRRDLLAGATSFDYQVMHRGKVREYRFETIGEETLSTAAGNIKCVRLKRIRDDDERETEFWMARDMDYLLVKLRQKEDNEIYELTLASVEINTPALVAK